MGFSHKVQRHCPMGAGIPASQLGGVVRACSFRSMMAFCLVPSPAQSSSVSSCRREPAILLGAADASSKACKPADAGLPSWALGGW